MAVVSRDIVVKALDELSEDQIVEVLDFIGYLQWRSKDVEDQSWFWTEGWQERYREAKEDLVLREVQRIRGCRRPDSGAKELIRSASPA